MLASPFPFLVAVDIFGDSDLALLFELLEYLALLI